MKERKARSSPDADWNRLLDESAARHRAAASWAEEEAAVAESQDAAWVPADNGSYDRIIDPRELRNEIIRALELGAQRN